MESARGRCGDRRGGSTASRSPSGRICAERPPWRQGTRPRPGRWRSPRTQALAHVSPTEPLNLDRGVLARPTPPSFTSDRFVRPSGQRAPAFHGASRITSRVMNDRDPGKTFADRPPELDPGAAYGRRRPPDLQRGARPHLEPEGARTVERAVEPPARPGRATPRTRPRSLPRLRPGAPWRCCSRQERDIRRDEPGGSGVAAGGESGHLIRCFGGKARDLRSLSEKARIRSPDSTQSSKSLVAPGG